jgi:hypothetical protein
MHGETVKFPKTFSYLQETPTMKRFTGKETLTGWGEIQVLLHSRQENLLAKSFCMHIK